jgi:hypothetical protein
MNKEMKRSVGWQDAFGEKLTTGTTKHLNEHGSGLSEGHLPLTMAAGDIDSNTTHDNRFKGTSYAGTRVVHEKI